MDFQLSASSGERFKGTGRFLVLGLDVKNLLDCETQRDSAFDGEVLHDFYSPVKVWIAISGACPASALVRQNCWLEERRISGSS
jgi:hypothetical protein